uniref:Uncharacterized protein n=2 Tax=Lotharella globosa TaxID=91324 RepID=A0A7S3YY46_9EUKA
MRCAWYTTSTASFALVYSILNTSVLHAILTIINDTGGVYLVISMHPPSVVVPLLTPHPRGNRIDRKAQNNQDGNEKNVNNAPHATARITHRELAKSSQQCKSSYLYCYEKTSLEPFYYPSTTTPRNQQARAQTALPPASEGKEPPEKCHYNHPTSTPDDHDRSAASAEEGLAAACEAVEMRWAAGRPRLRKAHVARLKQEFKEGLPVKEAYQVLFDSMENLSSELSERCSRALCFV